MILLLIKIEYYLPYTINVIKNAKDYGFGSRSVYNVRRCYVGVEVNNPWSPGTNGYLGDNSSHKAGLPKKKVVS
jgi:hypothetical protein